MGASVDTGDASGSRVARQKQAGALQIVAHSAFCVPVHPKDVNALTQFLSGVPDGPCGEAAAVERRSRVRRFESAIACARSASVRAQGAMRPSPKSKYPRQGPLGLMGPGSTMWYSKSPWPMLAIAKASPYVVGGAAAALYIMGALGTARISLKFQICHVWLWGFFRIIAGSWCVFVIIRAVI